MIKKLFKNNKFIFIFTFLVEFILYYIFEYTSFTGEYLLADIGIAPVFGLMFGPAGALGQASVSLVFELMGGFNVLASLIDFGIMFFISIFAYKLWYTIFDSDKIDTPRFDSINNILKFLYIIFLTSVVYWALINIAFYAYPGMEPIYPLTSRINRLSYIINNFIFAIIFGLFFISSFNTLKIPLHVPKKFITKINIKQKYFTVSYAIIFIYITLTGASIIQNDLLENILFLFTIIVSILYCLNTFNIDIKHKSSNYSIIEQIILIFLIMMNTTFIINFGFFEITGFYILKNADEEFRFLITIAVSTTFIILLSLIHIHYVEKIITNPIYELISSVKKYMKKEPSSKLQEYSKSDTEVGMLIKTFLNLSDKIKSNFVEIQNITAENERIETELNVASGIQLNMLPKNFEEFSKGKAFEIYAYMNPAREVGGDFYDYFDIDDKNISFVIGDVSGKGMPATLFMVKTMHLIKNHSKFSNSTSEIMEDVNNLSCERNEETLFVTTWIARLNLKTGKLSYVNAGHNPPLVKMNDENFRYLDEEPDLVIGIMENMDYVEHEMTLNKGDMIFLYTDGVTDANDIDERLYGEKRLKNAINRHKDSELTDIINEIKKDIERFCNTQEQFDDMTMLIIKYNGEG